MLLLGCSRYGMLGYSDALLLLQGNPSKADAGGMTTASL